MASSAHECLLFFTANVTSEVKVFVAEMARIPIETIEDSHWEVQALAGLSVEELTEKLWLMTDKDLIDTYHEKLGLGALPQDPYSQPLPLGGRDIASPADAAAVYVEQERSIAPGEAYPSSFDRRIAAYFDDLSRR